MSTCIVKKKYNDANGVELTTITFNNLTPGRVLALESALADKACHSVVGVDLHIALAKALSK
jgi:hypothetical protein